MNEEELKQKLEEMEKQNALLKEEKEQLWEQLSATYKALWGLLYR